MNESTNFMGNNFLSFPEIPKWVLWLLGALIIVGALAVLGGVIGGAVYVVNHLHWK